MKVGRVATSISSVLIVITIYGFVQVRDQFRRMRTLDTFGKMFVTLSYGLPEVTTEDLIVSRVKNRFPRLEVKDGHLVDAWGEAIRISMKQVETTDEIILLSAGPDRKLGTGDDLHSEPMIIGREPEADGR